MKNKGFTIIELLSAFALSSVIIIILFQLIINLKDIYMTSGIKTDLLNKQYIMTNKIYTDLNNLQVTNIENCETTEKCIKFTFRDEITKNIEIDETNKTITYDNYTIKLNSTTNFGDIKIETINLTPPTKILNIDIPIYNNQIKDTNFGINIVYKYDF